MSSKIKINIYAKTENGKRVLLKILDDTSTDNPDNVPTIKNIMRSTKLTRREKWKLIRNKPKLMAMQNKYSVRKVSDEPFIVEYASEVFTGTEILTYGKFIMNIKDMMEMQGASEEDYSWQ
jgi:hypothetical protein